VRTVFAGPAGCVVLADIPGASGGLVLGLHWSPLIGGDPDRLARRRVRDLRASHFVCGGSPATAVGCARLPRAAGRAAGGPLYSAAQAFAALYAGTTAAILLDVPPHGAWLAAVHRGAVIARSDRFYSSVDQARQALAELSRLYPGLAVHGAAEPPSVGLSALGAGMTSAAQLRPAGRWHERWPLPLRVAAVALAGVWGAQQAVSWARNGGASPERTAQVAPAQAWDGAIAAYAQGIRVQGGRQAARIFASFQALPVVVRGWSLREAACQASSAAWQCRASYARAGRDAANDTLAAAVPAGWQLRFQPLDRAELRWDLPDAGSALDWNRLAAPAATDLRLASALQRVRPAFVRIELGASRPASFPPPQDNRGQALPRPAGMPSPHVRTVELQGPLRSFALLPYDAVPVSWQSVRLEVVPTQRADLTSSLLMASLQGIVHEKL